MQHGPAACTQLPAVTCRPALPCPGRLQLHQLKEVIRRAGQLAGAPLRGVWSPAGKAYQALGAMEQVRAAGEVDRAQAGRSAARRPASVAMGGRARNGAVPRRQLSSCSPPCVCSWTAGCPACTSTTCPAAGPAGAG
jgi:hypothetical protein